MRNRIVAAAIGALIGIPLAGIGQAAEVRNSSFVEPNGDRVLQLSIEIAAPAGRVWKGLVDEETLRHWNAPVVHVDLRNGGEVEESYDPRPRLGGGQTIRHRILTYLPERLLVLQNISTPPGLPGAEVYPKIVQIVQLEPLADGGTRVTLSGAGYGAGAGFGQLYAFFEAGNAEYLEALKTLSEAPTR
jgi:uncharacterized protein YndB with AHSA1/START domain